MRSFYLFCFILIPFIGIAQQETNEAIPLDSVPRGVDSLYREDQFYIGFTFNLLNNKPDHISQSGFSGGLHLGFIRDFPVNKRRNLAIGLGLGWSINNYGQNLFIGESQSGESIFRSLKEDNVRYDRNRFTTQLLEVPLQLRWRSSTPQTYKFWRVYTGLRLGYIYQFQSVFVQDNNTVKQTKIPELERFRLGATLTFGYNTFNFHFYYSLNPFFKNASLNGESINISTLQIGLMFYIL